MSETEEIIDILTFDELLEDDYYKSEFDKRLQQELDIKSHSGVKGGKTMDTNQLPKGETAEDKQVTPAEPQAPAADPAVKTTEAGEQTPAATEPANEMSKEQMTLYNETLRRISKSAHAELNTRYNAFEDAEAKDAVKKAILAGETPDAKDIASGVVARLAPKEQKPAETKTDQDETIKVLSAELALVKAGIVPERLEAAKKLFLADGGDPAKVEDFVKQYPEWKAKAEGGVTFSKAPPLDSKTAAGSGSPPILNDFEKKVAAARKARGLPD